MIVKEISDTFVCDCGFSWRRGNSGAHDCADGYRKQIAELRAKLAKPVVLPAGYSTRAGHPFHEGERNVMIPNKHGDWLSRFQVEHAIHVAGFHFTITGE